MWHQPENLKKEVYNEIGTNFVTSFHYYMWNAWCKEECKKIFPEDSEHYWNKWITTSANYGPLAAVSVFYAELDNKHRLLLVSRAIELYNGNERI